MVEPGRGGDEADRVDGDGPDGAPSRRDVPGVRGRIEGQIGLVRFLLLEGLVVLLSVLAALGVDEWSDSLDGPRPFTYYTRYFGGYYTPDLSDAAWERANSALVAEGLPPEFYADAFPVYRRTELLMSLEEKVQDLALGALIHEPGSARVALGVASSIMRQEVNWIETFSGDFQAFLGRWGHMAPGGGGSSPVEPDSAER